MNYIKKLSIEHYKWFFEEQSLEFWIPDGQNNWSWLTVIVWPNNTWKTSIIEALLLHSRDETYWWYSRESKISSSERHNGHSPKISITFISEWWEEWHTIFTNVNNWSQIIRVEPSVNHNITFSVIQSRRYWQSKTSNMVNEIQFTNISRSTKMRDPSTIDTAAILKTINYDINKRNTFNHLLNQIIPNLTWWTIDTDDDWNDFIVYNTWNDISHTSWLLWDWIISVFRICAHLMESNSSLIIDEPELSLHPQAQKRLANLISEESKNRQIIICTHSPYFINWNDFLNWAKFVRLNKYRDNKCSIHQLGLPQAYSITEWSIYNYQQPELLDTVSKEIMFSEKILFVEWKEDVWLIKKFFRDFESEINWSINFDIFWYWSWWWRNIKNLLKMANDLWLEKVWALYDWDVPEEYVNDIKTSYSSFKILKLETEDIRDKNKRIEEIPGQPPKILERKEWVFNEHWNIKVEKKNSFKELIEEFINYFNS